MPAPIILIQARCGSRRLPRKVLADICGKPVLEWVIYRCSRSHLVGGIVVLTSELEQDNPVAALAVDLGIPVYRGSEGDVLFRYVSAARQFRAQLIVRVTADCPFIDSDIIDEVIGLNEQCQADYVCINGYPEGVGAAELVRLSALETALKRTTPTDTFYREHVTTYLTDHPSMFDVHCPMAQEHLRRVDVHLSVDTTADLEQARRIAEYFQPWRDFRVTDILDWITSASAIRESSHAKILNNSHKGTG